MSQLNVTVWAVQGEQVLCVAELNSETFVETSFGRNVFPEGPLIFGREYIYDSDTNKATEKAFEECGYEKLEREIAALMKQSD